jgi:hypothetical protein
VIVTARLCAVVTLLDAGATVTVGVVGFLLPPPPPLLPPPPHPANVQAIMEKEHITSNFDIRFIRFPFGPNSSGISRCLP